VPFEGSSANVGDYQVKIETCAGMEGNVFARDVSFSFIATK